MPIAVNQVSWSSYRDYEGPAVYGRLRFNPQGTLDFLQKAFLVTSCTEGALNSVNMYDACIMTVGAIQFCDRGTFAVCDMLGKVAEACGIEYVNNVLAGALQFSGAVFKKNSLGKWRFFLDRGATEVNTVALQQKLYLGCSGKRGSFTPANRAQAKTWAAAMASVWDDPRAQEAQIEFTKPKLMGFVYGGGRNLFNDSTVPTIGWAGMLKAAYISFAVNGPEAAQKAVTRALIIEKFPKWSAEWCLDMLHELTFAGVDVWPARYNSIRAVLEQQFGVSLPKTAAELSKKAWVHTPPPPAIPQEEKVEESTVITLDEVTIEGELPEPPPAPEPEPQHSIVPVGDKVMLVPMLINWVILVGSAAWKFVSTILQHFR